MHHFIRDHVEKGDCVIEFVSSSNKLENIFTKTLPKKKLLIYKN